MRVENACVVEEDVDLPENDQSLVHRSATFTGITDVGANENSPATAIHNALLECITALLMASRDGDLRAFFRKQNSRRLADARGAAGDQRNFVFQAHSVLTPIPLARRHLQLAPHRLRTRTRHSPGIAPLAQSLPVCPPDLVVYAPPPTESDHSVRQ